ncbi:MULTISPECIES: hypothetical protein [Streptomyces]|uniref:Uncharacterized protein n=1 Tax=Streptomyces fimbriatus TaxID=68197 RepID=A0ABW0DJW5_STRFI
MPTFAEKARKAQQQKRAGRDEKDPADLSGAEEPNWDDPDSWGAGDSGADDSASRNAGDSAGGNEDRAQEPAHRPRGRAPRRRGRPRGPERVPLSVRVLPATDRKLTVAVEQTGLNPQSLVEQALEAYFRRLKIEDPGPAQEGAA